MVEKGIPNRPYGMGLKIFSQQMLSGHYTACVYSALQTLRQVQQRRRTMKATEADNRIITGTLVIFE